MSNNKVYNLRIIKYKDHTTLYNIHSYQKNNTYGNIWFSDIRHILDTKDKYELKINLNILGFSFTQLTPENKINYNSHYNYLIKYIADFTLNSSYEN